MGLDMLMALEMVATIGPNVLALHVSQLTESAIAAARTRPTLPVRKNVILLEKVDETPAIHGHELLHRQTPTYTMSSVLAGGDSVPDIGDGNVGLGSRTSLNTMLSTLCIREGGLGLESLHHLRLGHLVDE